ncbi:uncharacterized protein LOC130780631 [Actinidia eriantha]|uniref:uncharacterized protein LOC130780631 n=1 Tax=Actinidia eriantha TaxID=165200 RepID=UPI0025892951|nr:uncharacterized protein LOC130780631 [Actinidia eriantha]
MDKEQEEIQFLGFLGLFKESSNIISSWRKIFTQITLALILPLSFLFLAHLEISDLLFAKILHDEDALDHTRSENPNYSKISELLSSEWTAFWIFKIIYFLFFLILSLLSTAAVVYTIACVYTSKEINLKRVISVVPKVWKRLMITFIWNFIVVFIYNILALLVLILWEALIGPSSIGVPILAILIFFYLMGFVYISVVWHVASVVSVLEDDCCGIQAMVKSKALIKGKMKLAISIFLFLNLWFIGIQMAYERYVVLGGSVWWRIAFGSLCFNLLVILILFGLVIQTVIYFVCKSYHHESINKSSLADHLEVYLGDYVPLTSKDVQLIEQFEA